MRYNVVKIAGDDYTIVKAQELHDLACKAGAKCSETNVDPENSWYILVRDSVDLHLGPFFHDGESAEVGLVCDAIERTGEFINGLMKFLDSRRSETDRCLFCGSSPDAPGTEFPEEWHKPDCPLAEYQVWKDRHSPSA
jgi:hypothetical protein